MSIMGTRVIRTEDPRLLTAGGVYVDDLRTPELNAAARLTFVRSPLAHARITGIDASEALSQPGVVAVLTVRDMDDLAPPPPSSGEWDGSPAPLGGPWAEPLLAVDTVRFVGEPVAVVITDGRYQGEDAADLVSVDYEPLPVMLGPTAAVADEILLFPAAGTNVCVSQAVSTDDTPFDACDVVVEQDIVNQRVACLPMEGRATAASLRERQADRLGQLAERAGEPADPGRRPGHGARPDPRGGTRRRRRVRRQDRHRPGHDNHRLGGQEDRPGAALGRDPQREHGRDVAGPRPAAAHQDRRRPRRPHSRLPHRRHPGHRRLRAHRRAPALPHLPDGTRRLRHPGRASRVPAGSHQHDADQRLPGGRPARGHGGHRARGRPVRRRDRHGPGGGQAAQLHRPGQVPLPDQDRRHVRHRPLRGGAGQGPGDGWL